MFSKAISFRSFIWLRVSLLALILALGGASSRLRADTGNCGGNSLTLPFTDVMSSIFFCQIAEIYFQGITSGTSPTTYSPTNNVTREQMAAFLGRTLDTGLRRGSERAALEQFWTTKPHYDLDLGITDLAVGGSLFLTRSDGFHVWVPDINVSAVHRVRASDGMLQGTWTGATNAYGVLCAMGRVFVTGNIALAGSLYMIDPQAGPGVVTTVTSALGEHSTGIGFDGDKIWTANNGSLSIVTPGSTLPWSVSTVGGFGRLSGFVYDGANMWVTDQDAPNSLKKLDSSGNVVQTVPVSGSPQFPIFDGKNIWVPSSNTVTVIRASNGEVLATLTGNGLDDPKSAAFDGERILVTNFDGESVSLWKATDLTPIGSFSTGAGSDPWGACSDGQNFWITLRGLGQLARF
jgi:hypothetical protein